MRFTAFLLVLAGTPAVWAQTAGPGDGSAADVIASCAEATVEEPGLEALEEACPGLTEALEASGYLPFISSEKRAELEPYDLTGLQQVTDWYTRPPADTDVDPASLESVLDTMRQEETERPLTWLERFKKWLRSLFARQANDPDSVLARWFKDFRIPEIVRVAVLYTSIIFIIVLAIAVVLNELRIAGVFKRGNAPQGRRAVAADGSLIIDATDADLDAAAADARVPLLLRMLVSTLVKSGRLRAERALTHSELGLRATFDDSEQRECFRRVALLAERVVYAGGEVRPEEFEPVVAAGRALNARLAGARA